MSLTARFQLFIDLVTRKAKREMTDFTKMIDTVGSKWQKVKIKIKQEIKGILGTINSLINLAKKVMDAFGLMLDPFQEYIFELIGVMFTTLLQMAVASTSTIIGAPLGVVIAATAGIFNVVALAYATAGMAEAREQMDKVTGIVSGIGDVFGSLTWL